MKYKCNYDILKETLTQNKKTETQMVKFENEELEKAVTDGVSCIAVPIEICVAADGDMTITAYRTCADTAYEYEKRFSDNPLSEESINWLKNQLSAFEENTGYRYYCSENEIMWEYIVEDVSQLNKNAFCDKCIKIDSNEALSKLCADTGCDIEIDGGDDVIFAVVENGKILSFAGVNDLDYGGISLEISVETAEDYKRMGYGSACVAALSEFLIERGYRVIYKCSASNTASSALAEKCGFKYALTRFSYVCEKI